MQGLTSISEDSSEISFLLVENYNYDHSIWSSDRMGIFGLESGLNKDSSFHYCSSFTDDCEEEFQLIKQSLNRYQNRSKISLPLPGQDREQAVFFNILVPSSK